MAAGAVADVRFNLEGLDRLVDQFVARGGNLAPAMATVAEDLVAAVSDNYDTSGQGKWDPLKPATLKRRRGGSGKPLVDTSVLANSTAPHSGDLWAEASTDVPYIAYHLEGGDIIPKRNPFEVDDSVYDDAELTILGHVLGL